MYKATNFNSQTTSLLYGNLLTRTCYNLMYT